ncbi:MAG: hypothetical protein FJZ75_04995 [Bacteroidetes bacterium]|jgi:hypothetical protein|nr:hypothetical protein [Bacteroidota bacterium]
MGNRLILFFLGLIGSHFLGSCGEEQGCTDPRSDYYSPTAEMNDGSCREDEMKAKFVGTWTFVRADSVSYTATISPSQSGGDFKVFFNSDLGYSAQNVFIQPALFINKDVARVVFWDVSGAGNGSIDSMVMVKTGQNQADLFCYLKGFSFVPNGPQKHSGNR